MRYLEFYGLLGEKLGHSLSPEIHEKIFSRLNINGAYKIFEVKRENLQKFADGLKVLQIKGTNVTIPYKQEIMPYLDEISKEARKINAVNTILLKNGKLYGYNTDYFGFGTILQKYNVPVENQTCMVLGYGGAAKAVVQYLLDHAVKQLYIVSRRNIRENEYNDPRVSFKTYDQIKQITGDVLINTTPVGMSPDTDVSPVSGDVIQNFDTLIDLIYNPKMTKFLKIGKSLNKKICGGMEMLVGQAVKAQEIWQNRKIPEDVIDEVIREMEQFFQ